ncbi:queuosine salvage protein isoform X1 [Orussus abietinus]|uniref:queuosine salvage protein isoform X1 n=1 Tax=Orussus abietinus TaxID=222816 RepID=UPI0006258C99|nr:queuosine salvage protein isoform X1 [Orussus abietinus]
MVLGPRESAKLISRLSKNVFIEDEGVKEIACKVLEGLKSKAVSVDNFSQNELHPKPDDPKAIDWIFVVDTLNFCFWSPKGAAKWSVNGHTGYFALCAAIKRAIDDGKPIYDSNFYSRITKDELKTILRGDDDACEIPLIEERVKNLQQVGNVLKEKYKGTFVECITQCRGSAEQLLKLVVNNFESYRDEADYQGYRVSFYKRAQILIGDVWACFRGEGIGAFHDIDKITMFADYRIPQVLAHFGAMRYSNTLLSALQLDTELTEGCAEEVEIRGCSIEVIERVVNELNATITQYPALGLKKSDFNSILIDHFLWDYRKYHSSELESIPFHKVRTIFY